MIESARGRRKICSNVQKKKTRLARSLATVQREVREGMPTKQASKKPTVISKRSSTRERKAPQRFRPSASEMPSWLETMLHDIALKTVASSSLPFEASALAALEEALEPLLEELCKKALQRALADGRDEITIDDIQAVTKTVTAAKKK